ncbi:SGNH/GDSL hydrolase family protein [Bacteroidota bacterium]
MRGGLQNSRIRFDRDKIGRVAFLGGSITYNTGWRDSICSYLEKRFPDTEFEFISAGIPSMGTTPAAFRLERDVLAYGNIDLLFEEAAVNDETNGRSNEEQIKAMEGIVRHLRNSNSAIDIVMMHFVDPAKMKIYREGREPMVIKNHNKVAEHYNIPTINLAKEVTERIDNGEFNWKDDFKNLHPSPFGQGIYANSMIQFLNNAFYGHIDNNEQIRAHNLPEKLDQFCYDNGSLIKISSVKLTKGWHFDPLWKPEDNTGVRSNFVNVPMLISDKIGSTLQMKFEGNSIGIVVAAGHDAGIIEYRINKNAWQELNLFTSWSKNIHLPWYYTLANELTQNMNELEIRISKDKDEQSNGHACRIRYFFVNRPDYFTR